MRKRRKGIFFSSLSNQEPAALGQSSEMQHAGLFSQIQILLTLYKCVQLCKIAFRGRNRKVSLCKINKAVLTRFSAKKWEKWRLAPATTVVHNSREPCTVFIRGKPVFGRPWVRTMDYQWSKGCPYQEQCCFFIMWFFTSPRLTESWLSWLHVTLLETE